MAKTIFIGRPTAGNGSFEESSLEQMRQVLPQEHQGAIDDRNFEPGLEVAAAITRISAETQEVIFNVGCPWLAVGEVATKTENDTPAIKELHLIGVRTNDEYLEANNRARLVRIVADTLAHRAPEAIMIITGWEAITGYLLGAFKDMTLPNKIFFSCNGCAQNLTTWTTAALAAIDKKRSDEVE
ncbi:MAG: hypothetical protein WC846_03290 [Candidatus Gracilibacteria bacterium]|jgi:hypothetical protein